jgi:N6-L-threonylcarbamoyladenine synthase
VVPEIAARAHVEALDLIIATAMADANRDFSALDGVAAAAGPGLIGGVIVGLTTAKAIALVHEKPLIAVNHLEAHALTARLTDGVAFPYCLFLASGGHTQVVAVRGVGDYVRLGTTRDDAIGEAFDKTAKLLGLGYPGGPKVEQEAARGDANRFTLPRPMIGRRDADFSLSGLKTALRLEAERIAPLSDQDVADLCASFQRAVVETVTDRLRHGLRMFRERFGAPSALVASGGVAANGAIRAALLDLAAEDGIPLVAPPPALCTDNGAMIAWAGAERLAYGLCDTLDTAPRARWPLAQVDKPKGEETECAETAAEGAKSPAPELPESESGTSTQNPEMVTAESAVPAGVTNDPDAAPLLSISPLAGGGHADSASSELVAEPRPQPSPASGGGSSAATDAPANVLAESPLEPAQRSEIETAQSEPKAPSAQPTAEPAQPAESDTKPSAAA